MLLAHLRRDVLGRFGEGGSSEDPGGLRVLGEGRREWQEEPANCWGGSKGVYLGG